MCMREWCREAKSENSELKLIRCNGKTWRLTLRRKSPKRVKKVKRNKRNVAIK